MHDITPLDQRGLRSFGLTTGAIVVALFALLLPWLLDYQLPVWPWFIAGILWPLALAKPAVLQPIYRGWMKFGMVAGAVNAWVILGLMFYFVLTPIALIMRLSGRDPLHRRLDHRASYRVVSKSNPPHKMERPF